MKGKAERWIKQNQGTPFTTTWLADHVGANAAAVRAVIRDLDANGWNVQHYKAAGATVWEVSWDGQPRLKPAPTVRLAVEDPEGGMSQLEREFDTIWQAMGGPDLVSEYRFDPDRGWRLDRAHPASLIAIEIDGGTYSRGRHVRPAGFEEDCKKINAAQLAGWRVFRLTSNMLRREGYQHLAPIIEAITGRPVE